MLKPSYSSDEAEYPELDGLPGVHPRRQRRSEETIRRLVSAANELLRSAPLAAISVNDLCRKAGTTNGNFYGRFEGKEPFFNALLHIIHHQRSEAFARFVASTNFDGMPLADCCRELIAFMAAGARENEGVLREALYLSRYQPQAYQPFFLLGRLHREAFLEYIAPMLVHLSPAQRKQRVLAACDMVSAAMIHSTLHVGILSLEDGSLVDELSRAIPLYLLAPANPRQKPSPPRVKDINSAHQRKETPID